MIHPVRPGIVLKFINKYDGTLVKNVGFNSWILVNNRIFRLLPPPLSSCYIFSIPANRVNLSLQCSKNSPNELPNGPQTPRRLPKPAIYEMKCFYRGVKTGGAERSVGRLGNFAKQEAIEGQCRFSKLVQSHGRRGFPSPSFLWHAG